jgi:glycosyltransferase involved in cell wall biosynthesis
LILQILQMLFSVVIPTYNRLPLIKATLASVFSQTFTDYEIIVVDDGSMDSTADHVRRLDPAIKVIRQANRGPGAARNRGAKEAHGTYIAFLDSDDLWFPWTLAVFAEAIARFGSPTILSGRFIQIFDECEIGAVIRESSEMICFNDYLSASRKSYSMGSGTCVFSREAVLSTPFLEDRLAAEDHDLILRMGTQPEFVWIDRPPMLAYRRHPQSETRNPGIGVKGCLRLLRREREGAYPGGAARVEERRRILARHGRPIALACLREGRLRQGWEVYRSIFRWNAQLGHWSFLAAFPILSLGSFLRGLASAQGERTAV